MDLDLFESEMDAFTQFNKQNKPCNFNERFNKEIFLCIVNSCACFKWQEEDVQLDAYSS